MRLHRRLRVAFRGQWSAHEADVTQGPKNNVNPNIEATVP